MVEAMSVHGTFADVPEVVAACPLLRRERAYFQTHPKSQNDPAADIW
jgi:hypothetical protein